MVADIFQMQVSPLELILCGSVVYGSVWLVFRFLMRRDLGAVGSADEVRRGRVDAPQSAA